MLKNYELNTDVAIAAEAGIDGPTWPTILIFWGVVAALVAWRLFW